MNWYYRKTSSQRRDFWRNAIYMAVSFYVWSTGLPWFLEIILNFVVLVVTVFVSAVYDNWEAELITNPEYQKVEWRTNV